MRRTRLDNTKGDFKYYLWKICDAKFCIIIDEAHDESKKEQMALVLRFVDKDSFICE